MLPKAEKKQNQSAIKEFYKAYQQYDYIINDIAKYIGTHYSTVCRTIKRIEGKIIKQY